MRRKATGLLGRLLVFYVVLELASCTALTVLNGKLFSFGAAQQRRSEIIGEEDGDGALVATGLDAPWNVLLHPYVGFGTERGGHRLLAWDEEPARTDPDAAVVVFTGGSVAKGVFRTSADVLRERLQELPRFRDKNVYVVFLGHFAWKQPQQLMATAYYLSLGGRLDLLINLDGHNEVVDTGFNFQRGVFPAYPWLWLHLASKAFPAETIRAIGEVTHLKHLRSDIAGVLVAPFRFSATANLLWEAADRALLSRISRASTQLAELEEKAKSSLAPHVAGPDAGIESWDALRQFSADVWEDSSHQMKALASARGAPYFHFLQPNQYVLDSKVLNEEELRVAFDPERNGRNEAKSGVFYGYPLLREAGERLRADGIEFNSLTGLYTDVAETIYRDKFCHVNERGSEMIAEEMAAVILRAMAESAGE